MEPSGIKYRLSTRGDRRRNRRCEACGTALHGSAVRCPVCGGETKPARRGPRGGEGKGAPWHELLIVGALVVVMGVVAFGSIYLLVKRFVLKPDATPVSATAPVVEPVPLPPPQPAPQPVPLEPPPPPPPVADMPVAPMRPPMAPPDGRAPGMPGMPGMPGGHPMGPLPPGMMDMVPPGPSRYDATEPPPVAPVPAAPPVPVVPDVMEVEPAPEPEAPPKPATPEEKAYAEGVALLDGAPAKASDPVGYRTAVHAAMKKFQEAADADHVPSIRALGALHAEEGGPVADPEQALSYYRRAGRAGDIESQRAALALVAEPGDARCPECPEWLEAAADRSDPEALMTLGRWALEGRHSEKSPERALLLFRRASERGHRDAWEEVGRLYMSGELGSPDPQAAFPYYMRAAEAGRSGGLDTFIEWCRIEMGRQVAELLPVVANDEKVMVRKPTGVIVRGTVEAVDSYELTIRRRGSTVTVPLGHIDYKLRGRLDPSFREELAAVRILEYLLWLDAPPASPALRKALTAQGLPDLEEAGAHRVAGLNWVDGVTGDPDYSRGFAWLLFAAQGGDVPAQYYVGRMYMEGKGVDQSSSHALGWIQRASDAGYAPASAYIERYWKHEENLRQLQIRANQALERERMEHAQALNRLSEANSHIILFQRGKDGLRSGALER